MATKVLIGINAAVFLASMVLGRSGNLLAYPQGWFVEDLALVGGGFSPSRLDWVGVAEGEWWRLVTGGFLHAGILHLGMNMLALAQLALYLAATAKSNAAYVALGEVRSSCWCATGRLSSQTIRPGETVTMEASVEAPPDPGLIERAIFVFADGYAQPATISLHAGRSSTCWSTTPALTWMSRFCRCRPSGIGKRCGSTSTRRFF